MTKKTFDCVEMKRRGAEKVGEQIAHMTREEELEFWRRRTQELNHLREQQLATRRASEQPR